MKNCFVDFCEICDKYCCKTIKFCSACQHDLLERVVKLIPALKNYFLSKKLFFKDSFFTPNVKKEELKTRNKT